MEASIPISIYKHKLFDGHLERVGLLLAILDHTDDDGTLAMSRSQIARKYKVSDWVVRLLLDTFYTQPDRFKPAYKLSFTEFTPSLHRDFTEITDYKTTEKETVAPSFHRDSTEITPTKKKRLKKPMSEYSLQTRATDMFSEFVNQHFYIDYMWDGKNAANLKRLLTLIKKSREHKGLSTDDEGVLQGFQSFLEYVASSNEQFHIENFTIPHLVSFYNNIAIQQSARTNGKQYASSKERAEDALIDNQKQSVIDSIARYQQDWEQSQG